MSKIQSETTLKQVLKILFYSTVICVIISCPFLYVDHVIESHKLPKSAQNFNHSIYYKFKNKIYARAQYNAAHEISADPSSFEVMQEKYHHANVARDKNRVFCSANELTNLDPARVERVQSLYYTDGSVSYYCSNDSQNSYTVLYFLKVF